MFVQNREVESIEIVNVPVKVGSELAINRGGKNQSQPNFKVINNSEDVLVVQENYVAFNVCVFDGNTDSMYYGDKSIDTTSVKLKIKNKLVDIKSNGDKFVYELKVKTSLLQDVEIAIGDTFQGLLNCGNYVCVKVAATSDTQLVLNCHDSDSGDTFFAILDKDTLNTQGDWSISLGQGERLSIDSDIIRYSK